MVSERSTIFTFEDRASDSSFVETLWRTRSEDAGSFISVAASHWEIVVMRQHDKTTLTVRGPETRATPAPVPEDAEFFGITFKLGTFMPDLPASSLVDGAVNLPEASRTSFWLTGSAWEYPDFENVDTFLRRFERDGLLVREPIVEAALQGDVKKLSQRSVQRRFLRATGLTQSTIGQIERAHQAAALLARGQSILDTVDQAGYFDQPHLTRSLRRLLGQTPAQIIRNSASV
jgi:AraC-like DNA-binding protein